MEYPTSYAYVNIGNKKVTDTTYRVNKLYIEVYDDLKNRHKISSDYVLGIHSVSKIYKIKEECENYIKNCMITAEQTTSGQDMSYYHTEKERCIENYKSNALNSIKKECIKIINNCTKILIYYDMLDEFKKYYTSFINYFDLQEENITWNIVDNCNIDNIDNFVRGIIMCCLSHESDDKRYSKSRKEYDLQIKKEKDKKELLYKREFECVKLFNEIEQNQMKSNELYIEYKNILELKKQYNPNNGLWKNIKFLLYFTNEKEEYLNDLISKLNNLDIA